MRRVAVVCVVLGSAVFPGLAVPVAAQAVPRYFQLGKFVGYEWVSGGVTSVSASWTVPRVAGSRQGGEATWIGAEGLPSGPLVPITPAERRGRLSISSPPTLPFIQVGTEMIRFQAHVGGPIITSYATFWSDTTLGYELHALGIVRPGDEVSASLRLAAHRWTVSISDLTTNATSKFRTTQEGGARFNAAEWLEEDTLPRRDGNPAPLPALSPMGMTRLAVDGARPLYRDLQSIWMSENGGYLAPSAFTGDAFSIGKAALSRAGIAYLDLAERENRAARTFVAHLARWTPGTSRSTIVSESAGFARALRRSLHGFATGPWSSAARPRIGILEQRTRALLALTKSGADVSPGGRATWRTKWRAGARAAHAAALVVRRALHVPEHVPVFS